MIYLIDECAVFCKTKERFGELSNMCGGFPLMLDGKILAHSSEALYQSYKFRNRAIREEILDQSNAMVSKMRAKKYLTVVRSDWDDIKLDVMDYCLRLKYNQHRDRLNRVLDDTQSMPIVERSHRDRIWGAVPDNRGNLDGLNLLGELWMIIRTESRIGVVTIPEMSYYSS